MECIFLQFFFFQAEDGIRDSSVTGVQTCALPIRIPVAGPYVGNARWLGASLASLLRQAGIRAGADQLLCTSADGFTSGTPVQAVMDGRDAMLAVAINGSALPVAHGIPVRMVVPGLYGYVSACKWITDIEVTTVAANHSYSTVRGWDQQAPVKT